MATAYYSKVPKSTSAMDFTQKLHINLLFPDAWVGDFVYCTISFNSAPSMTCYQLAEILISAGPRFERDIQIFSEVGCKFCARSLQIVHCQLNYIYYL